MSWFKRKPQPLPIVTTPSFVDLFNQGQLDTSKWTASYWSGAPGGGSFSPANVDLSSGMLRLAMQQDATGKSVGGEIQSSLRFGYGTFEWTARMGSNSATPYGTGVPVSGGVSGLFNFVNDSQTEIDFETLGDKPDMLFFTNWNKPQAQGISQQASSASFPVILYSTFNRYKFVWSPGRIDFYLNDVLVRTHTINIPTVPAGIIMNHWGTSNLNWGGTFTAGTRYLYVSKFSYSA